MSRQPFVEPETRCMACGELYPTPTQPEETTRCCRDCRSVFETAQKETIAA